MAIRYKFSNPDPHWSSFFGYAILKTDTFVSLDANKVFKSIEPVLREFKGRLIWPNNNKDTWSQSLDSLEFETPEDLTFFKLKFN